MNESQVCASVVEPDTKQSFNYCEVEPTVAVFLRGQADRLRRYIGKSLVQIGKDLIGAKRYLSHGAFVRWVENEVGIPARTAQGYMKIAQWAHGRSTSIQHLSPSLLYILSAQTTPPEIVNSVLSAIEAGQTVKVSSVREKLRVLRSEQRSTAFISRDGTPRRGEAGESSPLSQINWDGSDGDEPLVEATEILSRCLSRGERSRIYEIMTDPDLLHDAKLAQRIFATFARLAVDGNDEQSGSERIVRRIGADWSAAP